MDATTRNPPPESAEYHILRNVPSAHPDATCGEILQMLRLRRYEYADVVVIIDEAGAVLGTASTGVAKGEVQLRFREKLARARADPSFRRTTDWTGIQAILSRVFTTFNQLDQNLMRSQLRSIYREES